MFSMAIIQQNPVYPTRSTTNSVESSDSTGMNVNQRWQNIVCDHCQGLLRWMAVPDVRDFLPNSYPLA